MKTDVVIIGGGVVGCAIARELSRYKLDITLVEKEVDVAAGTSKANSGIIHSGYNAAPDTLKKDMNIKANPLFDKLCKDLNVPFKRIGSLVIGFNDDDLKVIKEEKERGEKYGIAGLKILNKSQLQKMEPHINRNAKFALYAPDAGIISPHELTIALADNAVINGTRVLLETEVTNIITEEGRIKGVVTDSNHHEIIETELVINAAGLFADEIAGMVNENIKIKPRKGEYHLYDKQYGQMVNHVLFPTPSPTSKGILITPTVHDNLLIGPNANEINNKQDVSTTEPGFQEIAAGANKLLPGLPGKGVITSFAGLRAAAQTEDFIIDWSEEVTGLINAAGIQSPGLTSSPAIAVKVIELIEDYCQQNNTFSLLTKNNFQPALPYYPCFQDYEGREEKWQKFIEKNSDYGEMICRCESVTKGEIIDAINRPVPAVTVDAVKRRTRAGMGRCQGGFCGPRVVNILAQELNISPMKVTKNGANSNILLARAKELIQ